MLTGRKKWADEDDDEDALDTTVGSQAATARFETLPDKDGIKTVVEYIERGSQTCKLTKAVKVTTITQRTNESVERRRNMKHFGKAAERGDQRGLIVQSPEDVYFEFSKRAGIDAVSAKDEAEERFFEESVLITEKFKDKAPWKSKRAGEAGDMVGMRGVDLTDGRTLKETTQSRILPNVAAGSGQPTTYLPPSLRSQAGVGVKGSKFGEELQQTPSLRVTNLSEDVREGDLHNLFGQFGRLQRVYLAKDMTTFQSRGFAFITYYNRDDGQRAIDKLHGHGYDNLILSVNWAKPRT
eukprot:TRINITY_DN35181_c0_g1_i1.p1 TRINITY_DN35181_c0_g1~~TRINITY_DN35181_c0_g1_i1.p1  ORF type:complete len:296 (+),score=52.25 TRINITY_DN35181_c0_g1_i1:88-975(+)